MPKVSVIIPVYKVEKYISRCVRSLMEQTLPDVEYVFVDDASPDKSIDILEDVLSEYPQHAERVRILHHNQNKGLPAARNTGLAAATGEYVFHCDSDDFVELNALEKLYEAAQEKHAEIVWCDYYITYPDKERYLSQPSYSTPWDALHGILCGKMKYNVWNKLVKRSLYVDNHITFPEGKAMGEDITMMKLFPHATNVAYVSLPLYHYEQGNVSSITRHFTSQHLESLRSNSEDLLAYMKSLYGDSIDVQLYSFMLLIKWPFLCSSDTVLYKEWKKWYPEANPFIWSDPNVNKRIKFVEWLASKGQFWAVWLHYVVVIKLLYSVMYK